VESSVSERLAQGWNQTRSTWGEFRDRVGEGIENATRSTQNAIDSVSQTADNAKDTIGEATETAGDAIETTVNWGRNAIDSTGDFISLFGRDRTDELIATWVVHHPILALIGVTIAIFLLVSLLQALGRAIVNLWGALLKSPVVLVKWLFRRGAKRKTTKAEMAKGDRKAEILERLKAVQQEQMSLLQELETLE